MRHNKRLYYNTTSPLLQKILFSIMENEQFRMFRLVGGTALSLQRGHRLSIDLDLFTDSEYPSIQMEPLFHFFKDNWPYYDSNDFPIGLGKSAFVGTDKNNAIKIDLYYTDKFVFDLIEIDGIRMASPKEIIAMKLDIIQNEGRKKDFWDIHEFIEDYTFSKMMDFHKLRYPFGHDRDLLVKKITDFDFAEFDFEPICLRRKLWELIKLDLQSFSKHFYKNASE